MGWGAAGSPAPSHPDPCWRGALHSPVLPGMNAFSTLIAKHSGCSYRWESRSTPWREVTGFLRTFQPGVRACSRRGQERPLCCLQPSPGPVMPPCDCWVRVWAGQLPRFGRWWVSGLCPMPHSVYRPWGTLTPDPTLDSPGSHVGLVEGEEGRKPPQQGLPGPSPSP